MIKETDLCYISGKITGIEDIAIPMFHEAERFLRLKYGCKVLNPVKNNPGGMNWTLCMRHCVELLEKASVVVLLPNWNCDSRGARIEYDLSIMHGIKTIHLSELIDKVRLAA